MGDSRVEDDDRMRFVLLDRIVSLQPGESLRAVKNLSLAEEYLADHFPGFPVMPGVLMLESLIQCGAWLVRTGEDFAHSTILLRETKALRYNNFVAPGHTLELSISLKKRNGDLWEFQGSGTVDGNSAVSARLTLEALNLADRNPDLKPVDERQIEHWRQLYKQLWQPAPASA